MFMHPRLPDFDNVVDRALREQPVPPLNPPGDACLYEGRLSLHRETYIMKLLTRVGTDVVKDAEDLVARCEYEVWRLQGDVIVPDTRSKIGGVYPDRERKKSVYESYRGGDRYWSDEADHLFDNRNAVNKPVLKTSNFCGDVAKELEANSLETGFEDVHDLNPEMVRKMRETNLLGVLRGVGARHVCEANNILENHRFVSQFIWAPLEKAMLVRFKRLAEDWRSAGNLRTYGRAATSGVLAAVKIPQDVVAFVVVFFSFGIFLDLHACGGMDTFYICGGIDTSYTEPNDEDAQGVVNAALDFLHTIVPAKTEDSSRVLFEKRREVLDKYYAPDP